MTDRFIVRPAFFDPFYVAVFHLVDTHATDSAAPDPSARIDAVIEEGLHRGRIVTLAAIVEAAHDCSVGARLALGEEQPRSIPVEELPAVLRESVARVIGLADAVKSDLAEVRPRNIKDVAAIDRMATQIETLKSLLVDANEALVAAESRIAVEVAGREVAEQRVCELREAAEELANDWEQAACDCCEVDCSVHRSPILVAVRAALDSTDDIAGRWVPKAEVERLMDAESADHARTIEACSRAAEQRDAAIAARDEAVARLDVRIADSAAYIQMAAQAAASERARDEVGIQLAAAQAEIARQAKANGVMRAALEGIAEPEAAPCSLSPATVWMERRALAALAEVRALDTVPGDALAPKVCLAEKAKGLTPTGALCCPGDDGKFTPCLRNCGLARFCDLVDGEWLPKIPPPSPAGASGQPSGSTPAVSHLEALGVDTSNAKEKA